MLTYGDAYREAFKAGRGWAGPEQPEIMPGYDGWYNDFWELSTDRQFGMAVGPIPRSSIIDHTREWPDDEADSFRFIMRRMDDVFRNFKPPKISQATVDNGLSPQERLTRIFGSRIN